MIVPAKDYKSRDIYIPDARMWSWWMQRKITRFTVAADCSNSRNRVVFGTKEDKYTEYPEKYGFISRRAMFAPMRPSPTMPICIASLAPSS